MSVIILSASALLQRDLTKAFSAATNHFLFSDPGFEEPDSYVVLDCKFATGLDENGKKIDLAMNTAQVKRYSFMLGKMQHQMPRYAYLATPPRTSGPLTHPEQFRLRSQ